MESLYVGLILAAISALTLIAYRHPKGYRNISPFIAFPVLIVAVGVFAYSMGSMQSLIKGLKDEVNKPSETTAHMVGYYSDRLDTAFHLQTWTMSISVIILSYLVVLYFLPKILSMEEHKEGKPESESSEKDTSKKEIAGDAT
jgi:hypothetical protein